LSGAIRRNEEIIGSDFGRRRKGSLEMRQMPNASRSSSRHSTTHAAMDPAKRARLQAHLAKETSKSSLAEKVRPATISPHSNP
jgi:hypothetical protein